MLCLFVHLLSNTWLCSSVLEVRRLPTHSRDSECARDLVQHSSGGLAPVLSEQMVVAPPIVSHAARCLTKLLSFIIFFMEYASDIVTARGKPSGTATTTIVTAYRKNWTGPLWLISCKGNPLCLMHHLMVSTINATTATPTPTLPIAVATSPAR